MDQHTFMLCEAGQRCEKKLSNTVTKKKVELWAMSLAKRAWQENAMALEVRAVSAIYVQTSWLIQLKRVHGYLPSVTHPQGTTWVLRWPCTGIFTRKTASNRLTAQMTTRLEVCGFVKNSPVGAGVQGEPAFTCWGREFPFSAGCRDTGWRNGF